MPDNYHDDDGRFRGYSRPRNWDGPGGVEHNDFTVKDLEKKYNVKVINLH